MKFKDKLKKLGACSDAIKWVGNRGAQKAWDECESPNWMLWLDRETGLLTDKQRRMLACDFAEKVLPIFEKKYPNDDRPREAIEVARGFVNRKATEKERKAAAAAAADAADAYAAAAAAAAAAGYAAAGYAATAAAGYAATAAGYADADAYAAKEKACRWMCDRIRKVLPKLEGKI
jgi:hypothetical protein